MTDNRFLHDCCRCGAWGAFSIGRFPKAGKDGQWFCREHLPVGYFNPPVPTRPQAGPLPPAPHMPQGRLL